MSVVKSQREEGKLAVITKAGELATYTIHICSNEKNFPKRYRWCITAKIVECAVNISNLCNMANSVFVRDDDDYLLRKHYQTEALAETYAMLNMIDIGYRTFGIDSDKIEYWTRLVYDVQNLIRSWKKKELRGNS